MEESENSVQVEAVDDYTLKMTFKSATPVEDWLLLHNKYFYVLPQHLLGDIAPADMMSADFWNAPVGSGPCIFESEISGSELDLASNPNYILALPSRQAGYEGNCRYEYDYFRCGSEMDGFFQAPSTGRCAGG